MTIQEAIKSGKRFRLPGGDWFNAYPAPNSLSTSYTMGVEMILRDDWEVEVVKKELSAEDIRVAFVDSCLKEDVRSYVWFVECLIKNLGLE